MLTPLEREELDRLLAEPPKEVENEEETSVPAEVLPWHEWLPAKLPHQCGHPFSPRHKRTWDWFQKLKSGVKPKAKIEVWPRGGGKSTTAELGVSYAGDNLLRRFCLYVCQTQEQADEHVANIGGVFEQLGVQKLLGKYGNSKGWRRNQLRTATGFNVAALGLDKASRGFKLDQYRPDLIILDDLDDEQDTQATTKKKIQRITKKILPAGSSDCAVLAIQNLVIPDGVFSQLTDGRADFLLDREEVRIEVAIRNLKTEPYTTEAGVRRHRIVSGEPTWEGQSLRICEAQIAEWGLQGFLEEAQQEVQGTGGYFFDTTAFKTVAVMPALANLVRAWDFGATQGGGDWTVGALMGMTGEKQYGIPNVWRGQLASDKVKKLVRATAKLDFAKYGKIKIRFTQDPGQAGKDQAEQLRTMMKELAAEINAELKVKYLAAGNAIETWRDIVPFEVIIETASGPKATRARGLADAVNLGNVILLDSTEEVLPSVIASIDDGIDPDWNHPFKEVFRKFTEDDSHLHDDDVDAGSDAFNQMPKAKHAAKAGAPTVISSPTTNEILSPTDQTATRIDEMGRFIPPPRKR